MPEFDRMEIMKPKILISEEDKQYQKEQKNKGAMQERLRELGYRKESEYNDEVSYLAW